MRVELKPVAQIIPAGHRLRLAISSAYWPTLWPSPELVTLTVDPAGSGLDLPLLDKGFQSEPVTFGPATNAPAGPSTKLKAGIHQRERRVDVATGLMSLTALSDDGAWRIDQTGTEVATSHEETMIISPDDPGSAVYHSENNTRFRRDDWHASLQTKIRVACTQTTFRVTGSMIAHDGEAVFAERLFDETIPRDHL